MWFLKRFIGDVNENTASQMPEHKNWNSTVPFTV
jgi:hypothetical protein